MKIKVYNQIAKEMGTIELPDNVFGLKWNADLVHQVTVAQASNKRQGTAHAKDRAEVRGGGRKPWRQKGTGRARHGSIRSPIWKGGGVTHGPLKEKNYKKKVNRKMAKKALYTIFSKKAQENEVMVLDSLILEAPKTKFAARIFRDFSKNEDFSKIEKGNGVLILTTGKNDTLLRAIANLSYADIEEARNVTAHDVLQYKYLLFPKETIESFKS